MKKSKNGIRLTPRKLSDAAKLREWKKQGMKGDMGAALDPIRLLDKIRMQYLKDAGLNTTNYITKAPKKGWQAPQEPDPQHLALLEHPDETVSYLPLQASTHISHRWLPWPYFAYLTQMGVGGQRELCPVEKELIPLQAKIWEAACLKAAKEQEKEGILLTPLGFEIIKEAIGEQLEEILGFEGQETNPYMPFKFNSHYSEKEWPIGPGFENFFERLKTWVEGASLADLEELNLAKPIFLTPWILEYTPLAQTAEGMMSLLPMLTNTQHDPETNGYITSECLPEQLMNKMLQNKHLNENSREVLVEWALGELLKDYSNQTSEAGVFFDDLASKGLGLSSSQRIRIRMVLADDEKFPSGAGLGGLGLIPEVAFDPSLKALAMKIAIPEDYVNLLKYSRGPDWLTLALKVIKKPDEEGEVLRAFKYAGKQQIEGIKRRDLAPLLASKNKAIREEVIRLATLVEAESVKEVKKPGLRA